MIVRIMSEGQYDIDPGAVSELSTLDTSLLDAVDANDEERFRSVFDKALTLVRQGKPLGATEAAESDLVLPPPDTSLKEARQLLHDEWPEPKDI